TAPRAGGCGFCWHSAAARTCMMHRLAQAITMPHEPSSRWLVSTDWLAERLGASDIVVVDGSSYLSTMQRDAAAEYLAGHIPGAVRFDIDAIADHSNPLPHMRSEERRVGKGWIS